MPEGLIPELGPGIFRLCVIAVFPDHTHFFLIKLILFLPFKAWKPLNKYFGKQLRPRWNNT